MQKFFTPINYLHIDQWKNKGHFKDVKLGGMSSILKSIFKISNISRKDQDLNAFDFEI